MRLRCVRRRVSRPYGFTIRRASSHPAVGRCGESDEPACPCHPFPRPAVIIPPHVTAVLSGDAGQNPSQRGKHIASVAAHGRLGWQKESGYGRRALVETAMSLQGHHPSSARVCVRVVCMANAPKRPSAWPCSTVC
jgi:hypothetical protein